MRRLEKRVKSGTAPAGGGRSVNTVPLGGEAGRVIGIGAKKASMAAGLAKPTAGDVTANWEQQSSPIRGADSWQGGAATPAVGCSRQVQHAPGAAPRRSNIAASRVIARVIVLSR
jgi:hypothetical protein